MFFWIQGFQGTLQKYSNLFNSFILSNYNHYFNVLHWYMIDQWQVAHYKEKTRKIIHGFTFTKKSENGNISSTACMIQFFTEAP